MKQDTEKEVDVWTKHTTLWNASVQGQSRVGDIV